MHDVPPYMFLTYITSFTYIGFIHSLYRNITSIWL